MTIRSLAKAGAASLETTTLGFLALDYEKQCCAAAPAWGRRPCAVLVNPVVGVEGAVMVRTPLFYCARNG